MRQPFAPRTCPSYGPKRRNHGKSTLRRTRRDEPKTPACAPEKQPPDRRYYRPGVSRSYRGTAGHPWAPPSTLQYAVSSLLLIDVCVLSGTGQSIPLQGRGRKRRLLIAKWPCKIPFGNRHLRFIAAPQFSIRCCPFPVLPLGAPSTLLRSHCRWRVKQGRQLVSAGVICFALPDSDTLVLERLSFALHAAQLTCYPLRPLFFNLLVD